MMTQANSATNDDHPSAIILRKRHDTAARPPHAARAPAHLPRHRFGCPPTLAGPAVALGAAHWYGQTAPWPCTGHAQHAPRRSLRSVGWLVIGSKPERGGAPRQWVETQRYRSSGRHDVSGCLRPCLIAYYDLCFLGTDSSRLVSFVFLCSGITEARRDTRSERWYDRENSSPLVDGATDN